MNSIVSMKWVLARMYEPDIVILDCRFALSNSAAGGTAFQEDHIPGAVYFDLEQDLSSPVEPDGRGGRHPLPDINMLAERLRKSGISNESRVVVYDDQGGAMASRLWWLLHYMGHEEVYLMDEGFSAWKAAGFPVTQEEPIRIPASFTPHIQPELLASVEDVQEASTAGSSILVDSREHARYLGQEEPIDHTAGHIPGAINLFWKENLSESGKWKSADGLAERFSNLPKDRQIIVYCGSGVTACPNVLALRTAGFDNVRLYAGSWSDWISYSENPIATGNE
ncbi:sulfurtransferase [Paenibacillus sp. Marseille-Q4541]|uniref:sulfurtransferase n=1 Tax=Paenibacillus sp. Marseille-Q4541 TaxID=2831522 RepID=UPI001BA8CA77|nr:sulfurtransferase [Paenibacillus sp. Marseille-Q4541]